MAVRPARTRMLWAVRASSGPQGGLKQRSGSRASDMSGVAATSAQHKRRPLVFYRHRNARTLQTNNSRMLGSAPPPGAQQPRRPREQGPAGAAPVRHAGRGRRHAEQRPSGPPTPLSLQGCCRLRPSLLQFHGDGWSAPAPAEGLSAVAGLGGQAGGQPEP